MFLFSDKTASRSLSKMNILANPTEVKMKNKLSSQLGTTYLNVINESHMHNVPKGAETHFKVVVVSNKFEGLSLLEVKHSDS